MNHQWVPRLGARDLGAGHSQFRVWAPAATNVAVHVTAPEEQIVALQPQGRGYWGAVVEGVGPGARYVYRLDDAKERPDPASRSQPDGVHAPSAIVSSDYSWTDEHWHGLPMADYVVYELHVGTFTPEGTFDAVIAHLDELCELGITAIELLPVAQFPGDRNWGYDGAYLFAVQHSYGGAAGLKRLVDACHARGLAVVLDVVYNHLGPEGNYLWDYGPYFTNRYQSPWGAAVNVDGAGSDEVRAFLIENALMWVWEFHIDAFRLDATHALLDFSARPFLAEFNHVLQAQADLVNRQVHVIAENDQNDRRIVLSPDRGGYGLDAQWSDEFHHTLHSLLTGERAGYYADYGEWAQFVKAYREGFVYEGQYSAARQRRHGTSSRDLPATRFVVAIQNHDQVGNRMLGDRLGHLVPFAALKLAAGLMLLSPYAPLLFMGEEYAEDAPFLYFISHGDPELVAAVRAGRRAEFAFDPHGAPPDPQDVATFQRSKLNHALRHAGSHAVLWHVYRTLLQLRRSLRAQQVLDKDHMTITDFPDEQVLQVEYAGDETATTIVFNLAAEAHAVTIGLAPGRWLCQFDAVEPQWQTADATSVVALPSEIASAGTVTLALPPYGFAVYSKED